MDMKMKQMKALAFVLAIALVTIGRSHASDEKIGVASEHPSPSPAGSEVVFSADFDGTPRLWISGLDGSRLRKIPSNSMADFEPAWSPDGRMIAFTSRNGEATDIWLIQSDGTVPVQLTSNGANNTRPAWSPDGTKLVFVSDKMGTKDIWVMNADGSQQTRLVGLPGQENHPSFSPSGSKIVFSETVNDAANLMTVNLDGSGLATLTTGQYHDWEPNWGLNGIIFSTNRDSTSPNWKLWLVQPDGSALRKVVDVKGHDPVWTRDGRILFTDESTMSRALAVVSILNPANGAKQVIANVQGYMVPIDIRPGKAINRVNPQSRGRIAVAILSTRKFDMTKAVNSDTLITFGPTGDERTLSHCNRKFNDVNGDGLPDLTCRFRTSFRGWQSPNPAGILRFVDVNGIPYEGRDSITLVADDDPDDFRDDN